MIRSLAFRGRVAFRGMPRSRRWVVHRPMASASQALVGGDDAPAARASGDDDAYRPPHPRASSLRLVPPVSRLAAHLGTAPGLPTLEAGAQIYLHFLARTWKHGWAQAAAARDGDESAREEVVAAARRYLTFMRLRARQPGEVMVPTHDIAVVWAADCLRPHARGEAMSTATSGDGAWYAHEQLRLLQSGAHKKALPAAWLGLSPTAWGGTVGGLCGALSAVSLEGQPLAVVMLATFGWLTGRSIGATGEIPRGIEATPAIQRFDKTGSGVVTEFTRQSVMGRLKEASRRTGKAWRIETRPKSLPKRLFREELFERATLAPETLTFFERASLAWMGGLPARPKHQKPEPSPADASPTDASWRTGTPLHSAREAEDARAAELADAVISQAAFVARVLRLGPRVVDRAYVARAAERYAGFLALARAHPGELLVPTLDVDLAWHAHMLSPRDYADDCAELLGRPLSHDAGIDSADLKVAFEATKERWRARHGERYVGASKRRTDRSGTAAGSCASCGYGHEAFHDGLYHQQIETEMLDEAVSASDDQVESTWALDTGGRDDWTDSDDGGWGSTISGSDSGNGGQSDWGSSSSWSDGAGTSSGAPSWASSSSGSDGGDCGGGSSCGGGCGGGGD